MTGSDRTPHEAARTVALQISRLVAKGVDSQSAAIVVADQHPGLTPKAAFNAYRTHA